MMEVFFFFFKLILGLCSYSLLHISCVSYIVSKPESSPPEFNSLLLLIYVCNCNYFVEKKNCPPIFEFQSFSCFLKKKKNRPPPPPSAAVSIVHYYVSYLSVQQYCTYVMRYSLKKGIPFIKCLKNKPPPCFLFVCIFCNYDNL